MLSYTEEVKNTGYGNPTASVALKFSPDAAGAMGNYLLAPLDGIAIPGGTEKTLSGTIVVPGFIPSGTYYLIASDAGNLLPEADETDN